MQDANWNVVALTDIDGEVLERYTYDGFGKRNALMNSGIDFEHGFTGQVLDDETGLMCYRNRYYSASLGRFVTRDPIGYWADDANLYRYVKNSPVCWCDLLGLCTLGDVRHTITKATMKSFRVQLVLFGDTPTKPNRIDATKEYPSTADVSTKQNFVGAFETFRTSTTLVANRLPTSTVSGEVSKRDTVVAIAITAKIEVEYTTETCVRDWDFLCYVIPYIRGTKWKTTGPHKKEVDFSISRENAISGNSGISNTSLRHDSEHIKTEIEFFIRNLKNNNSFGQNANYNLTDLL